MSKSLSENPTKRVKVTLACTICRKKKVKCDGVQPTCSRCSAIGVTCQYSDPPKKRGPPKGYVEVIENRARRIESLLVNNNSNSNYIQQPQPMPSVQVDQQSTNHHVTQHYIDPMLCLISGAIDAVLQQEKTASDLYLHGSNGIMYAFLMNNNVLKEEHISSVWIDNFFTHFNHIFPILSRPQFAIQFEKNELDPLLKLAVYLLGCRLNNDCNYLDLEKALYQQFDVSLNSSHDVLPDLTLVQATVIMCWYSYLAGDMQKCYSLRHYVASLVQKLNLGYESNKSQDMYNVEIKRRTFWVAYAIEQWLACCTGGERLLSDTNMTKKWDCKYPQLEDNQLFALSQHYRQDGKKIITDQACFSLESALQVCAFTEMIRLSKIVGDICESVLPRSQLEANLTGWLLQLPSYLDYANLGEHTCPSPIAKIYRILYYTVQIMLNKGQNNQLSTSICTTAANTIVHISEQMMEQHQEKYSYNVFFSSMSLAASVYLDNTAFNGKNNSADKINLSRSMTLIKEINCTLLARSELDQLINHFLADRCHIFLDLVYPSPSNSSSSYPIARSASHQRVCFNDNNKRLLSYEDDQQEPTCINNVDLSSPCHDAIVLDTQFNTPYSQQQFNLDDIFPNIDEQIQNPHQVDNWSSWVTDFFDNNTIETSATCSPASNFTPSHSPSLHLKEEDTISSGFTDEHFIQTFHIL